MKHTAKFLILSLSFMTSLSAVALEISNPISSKYNEPTTNPAFNQNDKSYLCGLLKISDSQCTMTEFSTSSAGLFGSDGIIYYVVDVRIRYEEKQCVAAVWKSYREIDRTWTLSEPTKLLGFPYSCGF